MAESTLARRLRVKLQLRDKKGRWIEMGGGGKWLSGDGVMKSGIVIGSKGNTAILREKNADGTLGTKDIHVNMKQLEMIESKASLDPNTLKLVNSFKNNQSAKGKKESDAREQALTQAKADLKSGKAPVDEAEVEYEATVAEELEDLLLDAPVGTKLEGSDFLSPKKSKNKLAVTKADDGKWHAAGYSNSFTSEEVAGDGNFADFRSTAADGKAINDLFTEASKGTKKGIFGKKSPGPKKNPYIGVPVNNLDDIINVTNSMLGKPQAAPAPQPAKVDAPQAPAAKAPEAPAPQAEAPKPAAAPAPTMSPELDSIINATNAMLGKSHENQAKAAGPAPTQSAPEAPQADVTPEATPEAPATPEADSDALIDISDWKYHQGTQGGSNPGGIYTAPDGQDYYVKKSKSDMHAKNEVLADKFYEKLGVETSQLKLADVGGGKLGTASAMVDGSKSDFAQKSKSDPEYLKKFQEDFAIDAWLANWDVVGLAYDNALTNANGDPVRIDPGGALLYRAMGDPKGDIFGAEVGEWDSMRKGNNPASKTFGSMTDEQLKASVAKLLNISDQDISDIVDSMEFDEEVSDFLKDTLSSRRLNLLSKYPDLGTKPQSAPAAEAPAQKAMPEDIVDAPEAAPASDYEGQSPSGGGGSSQYAGGAGSDAPTVGNPPPAYGGDIYGDPKPAEPSLYGDPGPQMSDYATLVADTKAKAQAGEVIDVTPFIQDVHKPNPDEAPSLEWYNSDQDEIPGFNGHFDGYNTDDQEVLSSYVHNSDEMNWMSRGSDLGHNYIKNDSNWASKIAGDIAKMDNLIGKSVVQEDTTVFRGVAMNSERLQKFMDSKMYSDLGFSSTSSSKDLADGWGFVDGNWQQNKTQVTLHMDLPAGFTAHRVLYSKDAGTYDFRKEQEVVLPRGTDFDVTNIEEYTNSSGQKAYRLHVTPILNDRNYKPEGIKNGQSSEDTTATDLPGAVEDTGNAGDIQDTGDSTGSPENGDGGGQYADPNTGGSTGEEGSEPEAQGVEEPEVTPEELTPTLIDSEVPLSALSEEEFDALPSGTMLKPNQFFTGSTLPFTKLESGNWQRADWEPSGYGSGGSSVPGTFFNKEKGNFTVLPNKPEDSGDESPISETPEASQTTPETPQADVTPEEAPEAPQADVTPEAADVAPASDEDAEGVTPDTAEEAAPEAPAAAAEEETIAPINGAQAILSMMAEKQGISLDQLKEDLGLPADGAFPNKGKTVSNDNGDVFEANTIVSNPKFGEGIASIILPSTNSVKVLYKDHGYKVTQAKNLGLVNGSAPDEVAAEAVDLSTAKPGDVGTNPANGKMYFVGKDNKALYIGDEVEYTKKGVTQAGKVSSIYKGAKTVKVDFADGTSGVKKASQLVGNGKAEDKSANEDTAPVTETQAPAETVDTVEETETPETAETVSEAPETPEAPATPETPEEAPESAAAPATGENKGWTPLGKAYDPMGPTTVQILPDLKSAMVYPHDHSGNQKQDYAIKGLVKYNPAEGKSFGVGHNLQPLYVGDNVDYLWLGQQYKGKIVKIHPTTGSATVELEDGTLKIKKFSQLRGNQPKKVAVDENGNYTDWHGNAAKIPNISISSSSKGSDDGDNTEAAPEATEAAPETPEAADEVSPEAPEEVAPVVKPTPNEVWEAPNGQSIILDGEPFYKIGYSGHWSGKSLVNATLNHSEMVGRIASAESIEMGGVETHNMPLDRLQAMGDGAKLVSAKLGLTATKDSDGDWLVEGAGFHYSEFFHKNFPADDWVIVDKGAEPKAAPTHTEEDLMFMNGGTTLTLGNKKYVKTSTNDGEDWIEPQWGNTWTNEEIIEAMGESDSSPRFDTEPNSNLSFSDLDDMKNGAEIYSEKLNATLTKDSDGDWSSSEYSTGYMTDTGVLDMFHTDDWVINSTGQVESNYTEYDLDSAPVYSELYSTVHDVSFTKYEGGDWENGNNGNTMSSADILSEYPDDGFALSHGEIDESYAYGQGSSEFEDLAPGSKINFTDQATEEPVEYIKIDEDKWATTDYSGNLVLGSTYGDGDFEDGYSLITHTAEEGEYTPPELLEYESNTPDMGKEDLTPEWISALPVGTMLKASLSDKWTYEKTEDGWATLDEYGQAKNAHKATDDQMFTAASQKSDLTKIFIPENEGSSEDTAPEEAPVSVADFETGTVVPLTDTNTITKTGDNEWKMSVNGMQIDQPLTDEFAQGVYDTLKPEVSKPVAPEAPEDVTPEATPETPEDVTPEVATPENAKLGTFTPETFVTLPEGSTIHTGNETTYTKSGDNSWLAENGTVFTDHDFISLMGYASASEWDVSVPGGSTPPTAVAVLPAGTSLDEYTPEMFKGLPLGAVLQNTGGLKTKYTKTDDGWTAVSTNGYTAYYSDDDFIGIMALPNATAYKIYPDGADAIDPTTPKDSKLGDFNADTFGKIPVGTTITSGSGTVYTKLGDDEWDSSSNTNIWGDSNFIELIGWGGSAVNWNVNSPEGIPSTSTTPEVPESYTKKLQDVSWDEFQNVPEGTEIMSAEDVIYTKQSDGAWKSGGGMVYQNSSFKSFIEDPSNKYSLKTPDATTGESSGNDTQDAQTAGPLKAVSYADFEDLPVGSVVTHKVTGDIYKKSGPKVWDMDGTEVDNDAFEFLWNGNDEMDMYTLETPEAAPATLADINPEEFDELPLDTMLTSVGGITYKKTGEDTWTNIVSGNVMVNSDFQGVLGGQFAENWDITTPAQTVWAPEKTLNDVNLTDITNAPVGSTITNKSGMVITKGVEGDWSSDGGMKFKATDFIGYANTGMGKDFEVKIASDKPSSSSAHVEKGVSLSLDTLDSYPVGTTLKQESPAYNLKPLDTYYIKLENGNWQKFKKTPKTLTAGHVSGPNALASTYGTYTVSKPKSTANFVTGAGEIGYLGDKVEVNGEQASVLKIMKTGLKVKLPSGEKITVKPSKVTKGDPSFGYKAGQTSPQATAAAQPVTNIDPVASTDFAGADAGEYNAQGLTMGHDESGIITPNYTLAPSHEVDVTNPLYGKPAPEAPAVPSSYPAFEAPVLDLPKWDSAEWLKKVEKRYADNPKKAKNTVQESNNWTAIQNVMNGEKLNLDKLLSTMYLDEDLFNEAVEGIDKQEEANAPLKEAHKQVVLDAKTKYEADKAEHFETYTAKKAAFDKEFSDWNNANPLPDAMKPVFKPKASTENFMGGEADWNKSHIGTHTAHTVMDTIRSDNAIARTGLSIATDSDKVENLNVKVNRIISKSGEEVFDMRFKATWDHGKTLEKFFKQNGQKIGTQIFPPNLAVDAKSGLIKELSTSNKENYGDRYEITHAETGARIIFQRDPHEKEFNMDTNHNSVRILMPLSSTPEEYGKVLEYLGIDGKPASEGDIRVYAENRLVTLFGSGKIAIGSKNLGGGERKKALDKIQKDYGITADDVMFVPEPNGKLRLHFKPEVTDMLADKYSNIKNMYHSIYDTSASVDAWLNILSGPNAGLASSYFRYSNAIGYNGQSTGADLQNGSGDYVYLSPVSHMSVGGNAVGIHPKAVLQRMDLWANVGDQWGKKNEDGKLYGALEKITKFGSSVYEIMPGESVHLNDFMYVSVAPQYRNDILKGLKDKGILQINGINIEDFVLTNGMQPPAVDYIPGIGVVPLGAEGIADSSGAPAGGGPAGGGVA